MYVPVRLRILKASSNVPEAEVLLNSRKQVEIALLAIVACLLWSTAFVGLKIALTGMKPLALAGLRFFAAGLTVLLFSGSWKKISGMNRGQWKNALRVGFFQTFLLYGFFHIGMTFVSGALGAIIIGASPLIAALTAHWMVPDDKLSLRKALMISTGISGIVLISLGRHPWEMSGLIELFGILLLVASSFASSFGNVFISKDLTLPPLLMNGVQLSAGGLGLLLVSLIMEGPPVFPKTPSFYWAFAWLVFISSTGFSIWFYLLKQPGVKVSELNFWKFILPVFGAILSWIILPDESPDVISIAGMVIVAGSVFLFFLKKA